MRRHRRVPIAASALVRMKGRGNEPAMDSRVGNISLSGLGIFCDRLLTVDRDVEIALQFISFDSAVYNAGLTGRVVYIRVTRQMIFSGIEFESEISFKPLLYSV